MPSTSALISALAKYERMGINIDSVIADFRLDAKQEPKKCGRGWTGTKPPGCTRAKKGTSKTSGKSSENNKGKTSTPKKEPPKKLSTSDRGKAIAVKGKPKATLPEDHLITLNPRFSKTSLDDALDSISTTGAKQRVEVFRKIVASQGVQTIIPDLGSSSRKEFNQVKKTLNYQSWAISNNNLKYFTSAVDGANGYTAPQIRHVVVATSSIGKEGKPFQPDPLRLKKAVSNLVGNSKPYTFSSTIGDEDARNFVTYLHEVGHQVHFAIKSPPPPSGAKNITDFSASNKQEWFAEHFSMWMLDAKTYSKIDPIGAKFIEDSVKSATSAPRRLGK